MINLERRKQILDILSAEGTIKTNDLSDRLGVTGATIRMDLRDLAREGAIVTHLISQISLWQKESKVLMS